ncbi:probable methyltransferase-like protein 24, partial [Ylistrum balloti]|uniref:probable methyltransferase-like protein 24 n=1 Tax=Ylistrum balloti TaxID=509963 RepID=UPI002905EFC8
LLVSSQVHCKHVIRIGDVDDGGWDVCNDTEYRPSSPCLVYSFGVAGDWSFDDEVSKIYGCEVHSFDPSIGKPDHKRSDKITFHNLGLWGRPKGKKGNWNMMNLKGIIEMLGHSGKIIDILKMDIESSEWEALPDMLATGVLKNVRQLDFEFHGEPNPNESHRSKLNALRNLNDQGFKLFWSHPNIAGGNPKTFSVTGRQVSSCYENYYLNTRLKKE